VLTALAAAVVAWGFKELRDIEREAGGGMSKVGLTVAGGLLLVFLGAMALLGAMFVPQRQDPVALFGLVLLLAALVVIGVLRLSHAYVRELNTQVGQLEAARKAQRRQAMERREGMRHIVHELRGPLLPLLGYVDMVLTGRTGQADDKTLGILDKAARCGDRLVGLVDGLSGRTTSFELTDVDAVRLIADAVIEVSYAAGHKGLTLTSDVGPGLPLVRADGERLRLVFTNLLYNAVKFTPEGGKVAVRTRVAGEPGRIEFIIEDSGRGIPEEALDMVFKPGFQVDEEDKNVGTGQGLSIVRQILSLHGAHPEIESTPGEGTKVSFTLEAAR
jgi:signal transduction histidine kinase